MCRGSGFSALNLRSLSELAVISANGRSLMAIANDHAPVMAVFQALAEGTFWTPEPFPKARLCELWKPLYVLAADCGGITGYPETELLGVETMYFRHA
jgi:hypothetical protein